ncbi:hypothetical protein pSalSNUABM01_158 [Salmonella phage pSal-SNUABM-01]|nr:hypothetical protein pSalSNUABM01_158 [Salmonella phage pSal-SNUABM-01]
MASKNWNDLEHLQKCKGRCVPRVKSKKLYKRLQDERKQLKANIKKAHDRSMADTSRPTGVSYTNNVWGF